jgi:hypothetical protein
MIVLFTDFGLHGPYTGQVLHQMAPGVPAIDLWVAKYKSGGDRCLKQTAAMWPPRVVVKRGRNC